ncbi:14717_t:CDS:2, partial [Cetraspora pellucida]
REIIDLATELNIIHKGEYNKVFQKVKDIETNIQKTIPEKVKDMKEDRNSPQKAYEQCPGCIFGKRNKKTKEFFCSKLHGEIYLKKKEEEELERLNQKAKKYDEEIEELEKDLKETDRDEIADLSADKKRLCREYQKNIEEKERILKEKNNYQQSLGDSSSQSDNGNNNNSNNDSNYSPFSNNNSSDNSTS